LSQLAPVSDGTYPLLARPADRAETNGGRRRPARVDRDDRPPGLSVIVPATGDMPTLPRCLAAINAARSAHDEVIVIDEGVLAGAASARNRGAAAASNPILVFVDADVEVGRNALELIRARFMGDPELAAVFGSYDDDPTERDVVSTFRNLLHHYVHQGAAGRVGSFWTGLGAVRRSVFEEVGGFDSACTWVEDIELGSRLRAAGQIRLDPAIQGKHLKRWTLRDMVRTDLIRRGLPWIRLVLSGRATRNELNLSWRHKVSAASSLAILFSLARRRPRTASAFLGMQCLINRRFYRLLASRGKRYLFGGVPLHIVHHITSAVSLGLGVLDHVVFVSAPGGWLRIKGSPIVPDETYELRHEEDVDESDDWAQAGYTRRIVLVPHLPQPSANHRPPAAGPRDLAGLERHDER
jgi:glycosyltransferase involved in cell wall biosynthesis